MNNNNLLRKQIKTELQNISREELTITSNNIATKITRSNIFTKSKEIACYIPIENEIDTKIIIETIWQQNKNCYLLALDPKKEKNLCFVRFMLNDQLIKPHGKFPEPKIDNEKIISPQDLELVIVPLLGFNRNNFRLGRGIGCYDRTFAFKKNFGSQNKPYLIGIGYEWQLREFENNSLDIPMDEIIFA